MGLSNWEYILRLVLSALFGGGIGLEREFHLKGAGIRTHLIVSFASCTMTLVSKYGFFDLADNPFVKLDPSRITAGLVTAIGFLGAGTIYARGRSVRGLTTAAGLWATVGIGMATGAGMYAISTFGAVFIVTIQAILYHDHDLLGNVAAILHVQMQDTPEALDSFHSEMARLGLKPSACKYERMDGLLTIEFQLNHLPCPNHELGALLAPLVNQPYIKSLLW